MEKNKKKRNERKKVVIWIIILLLLAVSFYFDRSIVLNMQKLRMPFLDSFAKTISYASTLIMLVAASILIFFQKKNMKEKIKAILPFLISFTANIVIASLSKVIIARQRPFTLGIETVAEIKPSYTKYDLSFPSFHSAIAFSAVPFFQGTLKYAWLVFALLVSFSRVYLALHYPSDIITGAIIGYGIAFFIKKKFEKIKNKQEEKKGKQMER